MLAKNTETCYGRNSQCPPTAFTLKRPNLLEDLRMSDKAAQTHLVERSDDAGDDHADPEVVTPIIVSLGKKNKKQIKRLKRGKGGTMDQVLDVIDQVQANLGDQAAGKILVPIVVIYRRKQRRVRGLF